MRKHIANEGNDCAYCCLPDNAVGRSIHLNEECNRRQCAYGPANRSESHMLNAERGENVATCHDEKAGEPRSTKFFNGGTNESARAQVAERRRIDMMNCH